MSGNEGRARLARWCAPVILLMALFLAYGYAQDLWLVDAEGRLMPVDFVNVWVSGVMAGEGQAAQCYDWNIHKPRELSYTTPSFTEYFAWLYPPTFFFIAEPLGALPYQGAWLAWMIVSGALFLYAMYRILSHYVAFSLALAFPPVAGNLLLGQNGMFTAGLLGVFLYFMDRRPALAGAALGLLAYKPQFSYLLPLVMLIERRWQLLLSMTITGLASAGLSVLRYGWESWQAFFHWTPINAQRFLNEGLAHFGKQQSILGLVRSLGGSERAGQAGWLVVALMVFTLILLARRRTGNSPLGAALLALLTMSAAPYIYYYDQVVLAVALAFLLVPCFETGFLPYEKAALAIMTVLLFLYPFTGVPVGFYAMLVLFGLLFRRAHGAENNA